MTKYLCYKNKQSEEVVCDHVYEYISEAELIVVVHLTEDDGFVDNIIYAININEPLKAIVELTTMYQTWYKDHEYQFTLYRKERVVKG